MKKSPRADIILIKPGSQTALYGELSTFQATAIEPPLWGALLAGYLRERNYGVELWDAEAEEISWEETAVRVVQAAPLLAVITVSGSNPSASTMNMIGASEILKEIKRIRPDQRCALCGLHPSALPEQTLRDEACDYVIQGEGFLTLPPLLDALKAGAAPVGIPGLWQRCEGQIITSGYPELVTDLDTLPRPAWDLLPMDRYRAHNWHCFGHIEERMPYGVIYTSLGCPFKCSFCCINALFGKHRFRTRSAQSVVDEVEWQVNTWGIRNFKLIDEMFAINEDRVAEICNLLAERVPGLNIWAYARVNTVSESMLATMKRAGINWIAYGFESGNERVLKGVTKGYDPQSVMKVVDLTYRQGLHICANFIFGLPEDDYGSMQDTLNLAKEINAEWANLYSAMAYPGSPLYDRATEEHWLLPDRWEGYSQYSPHCLPLPTKYLDGAEVLSFRDFAFKEYHRRPEYLEMLERKFGVETADYMREITQHSLIRLKRNQSI